MSENNESLRNAVSKNLDKFFKMHSTHSPECGLHERFMNEIEKILIEKTLQYSDYVSIKASNILGINRNTLRKKIQNLKISPK